MPCALVTLSGAAASSLRTRTMCLSLNMTGMLCLAEQQEPCKAERLKVHCYNVLA